MWKIFTKEWWLTKPVGEKFFLTTIREDIQKIVPCDHKDSWAREADVVHGEYHGPTMGRRFCSKCGLRQIQVYHYQSKRTEWKDLYKYLGVENDKSD